MPDLNMDAYLESRGKVCPACGSQTVGMGKFMVDVGESKDVIRKARCWTCAGKWDAAYTLRGCLNFQEEAAA